MHTKLRFWIHTRLKWSTGLAQHDTGGMDAEFRLSRDRKRADSASCLQLRGVLERGVRALGSADDSRLAAGGRNERKLRRRTT